MIRATESSQPERSSQQPQTTESHSSTSAYPKASRHVTETIQRNLGNQATRQLFISPSLRFSFLSSAPKNHNWRTSTHSTPTLQREKKLTGEVNKDSFVPLPLEDHDQVMNPTTPIMANMKVVKSVTGSSKKDYVILSTHEKIRAGSEAAESKEEVGEDEVESRTKTLTTQHERLQHEIFLLQHLQSKGIKVPNMFKPDESILPYDKGTTIIQDRPSFIAEKVDGTFIDLWKNNGSGMRILSEMLSEPFVQSNASFLPQLKSSLQRIFEYLHHYTIVDLQLIIPQNYGLCGCD